ncbi:MAG: DUF2127 domain-containing protein [Candidatus Didemnitutus sp.]|nr:DUF2127 domain-containing protein [Candidatus Didemnitutus sp.]
MSFPDHRAGVRTVAVLEACKGGVVLAAGFGLVAMVGHDAEKFAAELVGRLHLNPAQHYPQVFIQAMSAVTDARLWWLAAFALLYATIRFLEAYGLWHQRRWAEWLAALSGAIYIPVELFEIWHHATWLKFGALAVNVAIVTYLARLLAESRPPKPDPFPAVPPPAL